jgi:hypothetical protein
VCHVSYEGMMGRSVEPEVDSINRFAGYGEDRCEYWVQPVEDYEMNGGGEGC